MGNKTFLERLSEAGKLTPNEKNLARLFEREYHSLAFDNLETVSAKAKVSKSAVSRFVVRLGYDNFHTLMRELREEVAGTLDTPLRRHERRIAQGNDKTHSHLPAHFEEVAASLRETASRIREEDFNGVLNILCDIGRPLFLIGCATAEHMVGYFYLLMRYMRGNVTLLDGNAATLAHRMGIVSGDAALFAMSFARYPTLTNNVMRYFRGKGNDVILLTDRHTCPMLAHATHSLIVNAEVTGMFKTRCSAIAVMEALLSGMGERFPLDVSKRYGALREISQHLAVFMRE